MNALIPDDFKSLPKDGAQFESLVCQLLEAMGYRILEKPAIGTEGGRDILVERILKDAMVERRERVVIQCKHHAHSNKAVGDSDVGVWQNSMKRYKARGYLLVTDTRVTENLSRSFREFSNDETNTPDWASFWDVDELILYLNRYPSIRDSFFPPKTLIRTPLEQLAEEVRIWLTAVRYEVSKPIAGREKTLDMVATLNQGTIKQQVLVRCVGGEISLTHVNELNQNLSIKTPQAWLISDRRVSARARKRAEELGSIQVFNLSTLLRQMIWRQYFDHLIELVESDKVNKRYVDLGCFKIETDDLGNEIARERNRSLDGYIDDWLNERGKVHISLLADFGSGKTWFCRHYAYIQLQRFLTNPSKERLPLLITLRSFAKAMTAKQLINYILLEHYKLPFVGSAFEVFQEMNRRGKLLLILDGFDEMARKVDYQTVVDNFWQLAALVEDEGKVILTSRKEYFRQAKESEKVLGGEEYGRDTLVLEPPKFEVVYLEPFTNDQIRQMIIQRYGDEGNLAANTILRSSVLSEMARKPLMVELLLAALDEVSAEVLKDQAQVFLYATNRLLLRNIRAEKTFTSTADKLYFLCELAWEMIRETDLRIHYTLVPERIRAYFGDRINDQHELDTWDYDLRNQTLLHRDSAGYYEFAHKSLAEYFVALKFALELDCLSSVFLETYCEIDGSPCSNFMGKKEFLELKNSVGALSFGTNLQTVLTLLATMLSEDADQKLWEFIYQTRDKTREQVAYIGTNAFSLLNMRGAVFDGRDLSGLVLPNISLSKKSLAETDLTKTTLSGAQLQLVDLSKSRCIETNFGSALLYNVAIQESKFHKVNFMDAELRYGKTLLTVAYHPMGNYIVTDDIQGGLTIRDARTGKKLFCLKQPYTMSQCIQFNPQGDLIASGGMMGKLVVTDVMKGKTIWSKQAHADMIRWLQFSPNNDLLACVGEDHKLTFWNAYSGESVRDISTTEPLLCVAFSPNNQWIAAGTNKGKVLVWAWPSMKETWKISVSNEDVHFVSFSADSQKLLTGAVTDHSADKQNQRNSKSSEFNMTFNVRVWNLNKRCQELDLSTDYTGGWNRGAVSPTAPLVAARSEDSVISVWNYLTGDEVGQLKGHGSTVFCMAFDVSGTQLASCSQDGTVRIWDLGTYETKICIVDEICAGAIFTESVGLNSESVFNLTTRGATVLENESVHS